MEFKKLEIEPEKRFQKLRQNPLMQALLHAQNVADHGNLKQDSLTIQKKAW